MKLNLKLLTVLVILTVSACGVRVMPKENDTVTYWNLEKELTKSVTGNFKQNVQFKTFLHDRKNKVELSNVVLSVHSNYANLKIIYPTNADKLLSSNLVITVKKRWSLGKDAKYYLKLDKTPPRVDIIGISPDIQRGGSAVAVLKAMDEKIDDILIYNEWGYQFYFQEFITNNYFITLFGSFVGNEESEFYLVALDEAGNSITNQIDMDINPLYIRTTSITLTPPDEKEEEEEEEITETEKPDTNQIVEPAPHKKKLTIWEITSNPPIGLVKNFTIKEFLPFPDYIQTSEFGKFRTYYMNGELINQYHHLGIDMMHYVNNPIRGSNPGKVVYADYNGGYGNTIVIHHGMGLYSLYAHCSQLNFNVGDQIYATNIVALTGRTGTATGDHLHFSVIIQGMYVDPAEWMDMDWIQENILEIIQKSRNIIYTEIKS